jgi:hypothetical protein
MAEEFRVDLEALQQAADGVNGTLDQLSEHKSVTSTATGQLLVTTTLVTQWPISVIGGSEAWKT